MLHYKINHKNYVVVHAGLNFHSEQIFDDKYSMLWAGDTFVNQEILENKIINLDTGCVFRGEEGIAYLTVFNLEKRIIHVQECANQIVP